MNFDERKKLCDDYRKSLVTAPYHCKKGSALNVTNWMSNEWELFQTAKKNRIIQTEYDDFETRPIVYESNEMGYRSEYWNPRDMKMYGIAVGSSNTWGSGLHYEDRFDTLIAKEIGFPIINLGWPGGSCNYVKEQVEMLLMNNLNKPAFVIVEWPPLTRLTLWTINDFEIINAHFNDIRLELFEKILDLNEKILYAEAVKSVVSVHNILNHFSIPFFEWTITPDSASVFDLEIQEFIDYARDGVHPGPKTNLKIKNKFIEFYNKHV